MQLIIPDLKSAQFLWGSLFLLHRALFFYLAISLLFSAPQTNRRQPQCQFHARVVSSAAEIIHCKIDLNNRKVEQQGKAGGMKQGESVSFFWKNEEIVPVTT